MKKIYVFFIAVFFLAFVPKIYSQQQFVQVNMSVPANPHNVVVQDVILNVATSQNGIEGTTNVSFPYYGLSMVGTGEVYIGSLTPTTIPTNISNAYIVNILPTESYITVYNPNSNAVTGSLQITFWDAGGQVGYSVGSGNITLNPKTTTTIPVTSTMTHQKTYLHVINNILKVVFTGN